MIRFIALAASLYVLVACSGSNSPGSPDTGNAVSHKTAKAAQKTIFDNDLKALDKARGVQKVLDDGAKRTDQAIKDSGG